MKKHIFFSWICMIALFAALAPPAPAVWADDDAYQRQLNDEQERQRQAGAQQAEAQRQADWQQQQDQMRRDQEEQQRQDELQRQINEQRQADLQQQQEQFRRQQDEQQRQEDERQRQLNEQRQADWEQQQAQIRRQQDEQQQQQQQAADAQRRQQEEDAQQAANARRRQQEDEDAQRRQQEQATDARRRQQEDEDAQQRQQEQAAGAQRRQQEEAVQQAADARRRQQAADAQQQAADAQRQQHDADAQNHPVQMAGAFFSPKDAPPNGEHVSAEGIVHPNGGVAAIEANRATVSGRWLLLGLGALSLFLMAVPLASIVIYERHHGRQEEGPRVGRFVAVTPGRAPGRERGAATARAATLKRRCLSCGKGVSVIGGKVGKRFRCPGCQTVQTIST